MKNLVIVLKRGVVAGLLGSGIGLGGAAGAWAVSPERPAPAASLDGSISATGSYLAGRHAQQTDDWPAAAEFMGRALASDPQNIGLLRRIYLRLGDGKLPKPWNSHVRWTAAEPGNHLAKLLLVCGRRQCRALRRGRAEAWQRPTTVSPASSRSCEPDRGGEGRCRKHRQRWRPWKTPRASPSSITSTPA